MHRLIERHAIVSTLLVAMVVGIATFAVERRLRAAKTSARRNPLGLILPDVQLTASEGAHVSLRHLLGAKPAFIFIVRLSDCASCSNLPLELRILHNEAPELAEVVIGSGAGLASFAPSFKQLGLASSALVDENGALLRTLGVSSTPLFAITDSAGRILFIDSRSSAQAAQYPVGRVLHNLLTVLRARGPTG